MKNILALTSTYYGSIKYYEEFNRVLNLVQEDYIDNKMSIPEMAEKYNHGDWRNFNKILNSLGLEKRSLSDSQSNLILNNPGYQIFRWERWI